MGMQYDVKSQHAGASGLMVGYRVRLKGAVIFPFTGATGYTTLVDNTSIVGTFTRTTTTATVTAPAHGLRTGMWAYLDWALASNPYQVTVVDANTFTVTVANSGAASGAVTVWPDVLLQLDASNQTAYSVPIPGEGVLAQNGIRIFLAADMHATVFYG
jgi:hypothetical protein